METSQPKQRYFIVGRKGLGDTTASYAVMDITDRSIVTRWVRNSYYVVRAKAWSLESSTQSTKPEEFDITVKFVKTTRFDKEHNEYAVFVLNKEEMRSQLRLFHGNRK